MTSSSRTGEEAQNLMQESLLQVINSVDKSHLRRIQLKMHECASVCCRNTGATMEQTQNCVESCSLEVRQAQNKVAGEIQNFQNSLQNCVMRCEGKLDEDGLTGREVKDQFDKCAIQCFDEHRVKLLPGLLARLQASIGEDL